LKVLLLGYSAIARKRIINFFLQKKIKFSVATKSYKEKIDGSYEQFNSYDKGIRFSKADIIYISLPNSHHFYWAKKALMMKYHVIVDKPICAKFNQVKELINLSKKNKRIIVEATYFNYHKQVKKLLNLCSSKHIDKINAKFVIPFPKRGIRTSNKLGGGALMDMGPYIAAVPRLFNLNKIKSKKIQISKNKNNLIVSINFKIIFNKLIYNGLFKFGGDYKNELIVNLTNKSFKIERVFSPPEKNDLSIFVNSNGKKMKMKIKRDNCFSNFFNEVIKKINEKNFFYYHKRILIDAYFREKILR